MSDENWWESKALLPFHSPTTILLSGATMSGKTTLTYEILKHAKGMFEIPPQKIVYAYGEYQPLYNEMEKTIPELVLHQNLPSKEDIDSWSTGSNHTILILDDLLNQVTQNQDSVYLFCVTAHHRRVTVLFLTQNLYMPGKYARTISLNCHYFILFRNVRDARQIITFGSQVFPGKVKYFKDAYEKATTVPYGYLLVDVSPRSPDKYRLRTRILPGEDTTIYLPKA